MVADEDSEGEEVQLRVSGFEDLNPDVEISEELLVTGHPGCK